MGAWNGSIQTLVCPNLARVVGIPTSGFHSRLKMSIFSHNLPRATYWRFLLLRCRTAGSLNHLPGHVVQCRGTYVPASGQQILYGSVDLLFLHLDSIGSLKCITQVYVPKGNLEDWFGVGWKMYRFSFCVVTPPQLPRIDFKSPY